MVYRSDFAIRAVDGSVAALVEVKNRVELSSQLASSMRRNLVAHGLSPVRYFLLLSQDRGYVWKETTRRVVRSASPTAEFPMVDVISRYLPNQEEDVRLRDVQLQLIVGQWLDDLTRDAISEPATAEKVLSRTGFLDDVKGASVLTEALV